MKLFMLLLLLAGCTTAPIKKEPVMLEEDVSVLFHYQVWEEYDKHGEPHRYILELKRGTRKDWR